MTPPFLIEKKVILYYNECQTTLWNKCCLNFLRILLSLTENPGKIINQEIKPTDNWIGGSIVVIFLYIKVTGHKLGITSSKDTNEVLVATYIHEHI